MIVFYTKYNVIDSFDIEKLLECAFNCVTGMKNVPDNFKNITWDGQESGEWKSDRNILAFEIDDELSMVAFRVAIVDENEELWTEDIALDCTEHEIQLRLAREKRIASVEYSRDFNLPYLFKKIIRDGIGGMDADLPVVDKPLYIDEKSIEIVKTLIIEKKSRYSLPVIYISCLFSNNGYEVDVDELAKDMAGSAHVLVEKASNLSKILRDSTNGQNPYNGAVDIFYSDNFFRYLKRSDITSNQYRYKISHAVYARMAMRNIEDKYSLSTIRLRNRIKHLKNSDYNDYRWKFKIEELEEKCQENKDLYEYASEEIKKQEKKINELENENYKLNNKVNALMESLNRKNGNSFNDISLLCSENPLYDDEIKRMVIECIKKTISTYGDDERKRRDYHVLKSIIDNNSYSEIGNNIKRDILRLLKKNKFSKTDIAEFKNLGFEVKSSGHDKYIFHGDDRYIITVSNTPSDFRSGENLAHEAINLIFGRF